MAVPPFRRAARRPWAAIRNLLLGACAAIAIVLGNGCAVGPDYRAPQTVSPAAYQNAIPTNAAAVVVTNELARWWTVFRDPQLDSLIQRAAAANLELKLAEARLREARALRGRARSAFFPDIDASGSYSRSRISENSLNGTGLNQFGIPLENDTYTAGLDMNWEIDVFGGTRRNFEAATADLAATAESRNAARVSVLAEVGLNYLELRGLQRQLAITRDNLRTQEDTAAITRDRLKAGLGTDLDVARASAQAERTRALLPPLENIIQQTIHRLSVLLGSAPATLTAELAPTWKLPVTSAPGVPVGLPSELLRRRPDVRQAERELAAATARIGVATAELFPKFYLTGTAGLQSIEASDFFDGGSRFWSLGPTLRWPVFNAGQIRQTIRLQEAKQEQALIRYEQTVLTSLEETENALVSFGKEQERHRSLRDSETASRRAVDLANAQHRAGLVDFLNVLEAERTLLGVQEELAISDRRLGQNLIRLYKALGGGWESDTAPAMASARP